MVYIRNNKSNDFFDHKTGAVFVQKELVTENEFSVFFPSLNQSSFEKVNVKKCNTYKIFGLRFECTTTMEDINHA